HGSLFQAFSIFFTQACPFWRARVDRLRSVQQLDDDGPQLSMIAATELMQCLSEQPNCRVGCPPLYCSQVRVGRQRNEMFNAMAVEPVAHPNPYSTLIGLQPNVVAAEGEAVHDRTDIALPFDMVGHLPLRPWLGWKTNVAR